MRQRHQALVQHRQAADARVEHADRPLVHLPDCREAGCRLPSLRAPGPPRRGRDRALERGHSARGLHVASLRVTDASGAGHDPLHRQRDGRSDREAHFLCTERLLGLSGRAGQPTLGTVTAQGTAADLGDALLPLTGTVQVRAANGTFYVRTRGQPTPLAAAATQCTGTATHTALLGPDPAGIRADARAAGLRRLPDRAAGECIRLGSIQACLPPPDVPVGTPGRATFGFKLTQVNFKVNGIFTSDGPQRPAGGCWRRPTSPARARANAAGTVEAQSVIAFPRSAVPPQADGEAHEGLATLTLRGDVRSAHRGAGNAPALPRQAAGRLTPSVTLTKSGTSYSRHAADQATAKPQIVFLQAQGGRRGRHGPRARRRSASVRRRHARGCRRAQRHRPLRDPGSVGSPPCVIVAAHPRRHVGPGVFADAVRAAGHELVDAVSSPAGRPEDDADAVIVLGGAMHPDEDERHGWLARSCAWLERLLDAGRRCSASASARSSSPGPPAREVFRSSEPEVGWLPVEVHGRGRRRPVAAALPERFDAFEWHHYTHDLPDGAVELAAAASARRRSGSGTPGASSSIRRCGPSRWRRGSARTRRRPGP